MTKLVVFLGNPGEKYTLTRHNVGFLCGEYVATQYGFNQISSFKTELIQKGSINDIPFIFLYPQTFMNLSGNAVAKVQQFFKIPLEDVLVVYDDVDIDFGLCRFRLSGSPGTHNGMKHISQIVASKSFKRARIGVGPIPLKWDLSDFVLSNFTSSEQANLPQIFDQVSKCLDFWTSKNFEYAMNQCNGSAIQ